MGSGANGTSAAKQRSQPEYADCPQLLRDYLFYLKIIKGRSPRTVDGYYIDLRTFLRFICRFKGLVSDSVPFDEIPFQQIDLPVLADITISDLYEFLNFTTTDRNNHAAARARKVCSIRGFFKYLTTKVNLLENDPTKNLDLPGLKKSLPKYLTLEQCLELLNHVEGPYAARDYCMITLFLNCGMRLSELVGLNLNSIQENRIRVLGKGNKERVLYLNQACIDALTAYLPIRNAGTISPTDRNALFLTRSGKRIGARRVEQIIEENLKRAGLDQYGFSTHKLRHTAATMMYQKGGVDVRVLQEILGHANLGTTQIYTHTSSEQMEQAVSSTPLAHIKPPTEKKKKSK